MPRREAFRGRFRRPAKQLGKQFTGRFGLRFYIESAPLNWHSDWGPVAQGIEQQPSKLKVAGSNPAGVANFSRKPSRAWRRSRSPAAAKRDAMSCSQAFSQLPLTAAVGHR